MSLASVARRAAPPGRSLRGALSLGRGTFALAVLVALALPPEACTLAYGLLLLPLLWRQGFASARALAWLGAPLGGLFVLGICVDYAHLDGWAFAQDAWRMLKPLLLLVLGFTAVRSSRGGRVFPRSFVVVGLVYACAYLARLAQASLAAELGPLALSDTLVVGHFPEALTLGIVLRLRRGGPGAARGDALLFPSALAAAGLALLLSGSRTWVLVALLMLLAGTGWLRKRGRWRGALFALASLLALFLTPFGSALFTRGFDVALNELSPARYTVLGDIHQHWRGFETWRALHAFGDGTPLQQVLGQGFGAKADLGLYMELGGVDFREIGQFHNGLVWVLLKTGYLGLCLFLLWFARLFRLCWELARQGERAAADLCLGVVLSLALTTIVVSGIFNPLSNDVLVLSLGGFLALVVAARAVRAEGARGKRAGARPASARAPAERTIE